MFRDSFKSRYTTIPFAFCKQRTSDTPFNLLAHQHKEAELISVVEGSVDFYIDCIRYELKAGDALVIPPFAIHRASVSRNTYYDCICFDLSLLWDKTLTKGLERGALTVSGSVHASLPYTSDVRQCIKCAIDACERGAAGWELDAIGNLSILFSRLKSSSFFVASTDKAPEHSFGKSVLEYIKMHFSESITSRTAAVALYLNNSYFCRLFKKNFGCCFSEYLLEYRIEKAKSLLRNRERSISEIAIGVGFNSFSYFSKVFKRQTGMSPSEYRGLAD
ncbi:MAG: helix-turn-helix domain-containing protein [Clostridia bacterium]|nr:helix-turn-helix domain-containing protein [Clostridia bacterium]